MTHTFGERFAYTMLDLFCELYANSPRRPTARDCYQSIRRVADEHGIPLPNLAEFKREFVRRMGGVPVNDRAASHQRSVGQPGGTALLP